MPPDLDARVVDRAAQLDRRLAHPDADLVDREGIEDRLADRLGDRLEQPDRRTFDDLPDELVHAAVVDRLREVVADPGRLEVEQELDVDLEGLRRLELVLVIAVPALESDVVQDDPVGQGVPPSAGPPVVAAGVETDARLTASAIRAARRFGWTSWTRTMSTPAATPSAVVASVASSRWSAGRSRTLPSVDLREVPSRIGRPRTCSAASSRGRTRLWAAVLPNPKPGSTTIASQPTPQASARSMARSRSATISAIRFV